MPILNRKEGVETRMMREMREKQREAGLSDTHVDIPHEPKIGKKHHERQ